MAGKLGSVQPEALVGQVKNNINQALAIAAKVPGAQPFRAQIVGAANESFVSGLHIIGVVAAIITLLAAVGVLIFLPARARDDVDVNASAVELEPFPVGVAG
jgi:hypothetical protein